MSSPAGDARPPQNFFPLLAPERVDLPIVRHADRVIVGGCFLAAVERVAGQLPEGRWVVNLCADRSRFLLGFAAALARGQTTLLPPNRADATLRRLRAEYPDSYAIVDGEPPRADFRTVSLAPAPFDAAATSAFNPAISADHLAAVAFTSGSTGTAHACRKSWGLFCRSVDLIAGHLDLHGAPLHHALATVPAQHMYGLETTILLALRAPVVATDRQAFYPADIHAALAALPRPRMLVTTPLHLRACLDGNDSLPPVDLIVSATAPLTGELAADAETRFGGKLLEIFGFSEAGSVAARRTVATDVWTLFDGLRLVPDGERYLLGAPYLPEAVTVQDRIEPLDSRRFRWLGRWSEQVNIAGKRTSIGALNAALAEVEGVRDGVFFMPERAATTKDAGRLSAFAVAPGLTPSDVLAALREKIDPAFLPRPLVLLEALPRLDNGKITREALEVLARLHLRRDTAEPE